MSPSSSTGARASFVLPTPSSSSSSISSSSKGTVASERPASSSPSSHSKPPALHFNSPSSPPSSSPSISSAPSPAFLKTPAASFSARRKPVHPLSVENIPRQTILKALASSRPSLSIAGNLADAMSPTTTYVLHSPGAGNDTDAEDHFSDCVEHVFSPPLTAKYLGPSLQSPCFYHQRFDNAVNVERVLEEIAGDEYTSHSRLVQTALGVREVARQLQRRTCRMNVKNVMIVTKARDNQLVTLTRELAHWLMKTPRYGNNYGVNVYVDKKLRDSKRFNAPALIEEEPRFRAQLNYWTPDLCWSSPETFDLVLTLGGDGTVLYTSWLFQRVVPPILSFSLGSLGFLTGFKFELYKEHLNKVLNDGMRVNMRMRFTCTVYREENGQMNEGDQFEVLNGMLNSSPPL